MICSVGDIPFLLQNLRFSGHGVASKYFYLELAATFIDISYQCLLATVVDIFDNVTVHDTVVYASSNSEYKLAPHR